MRAEVMRRDTADEAARLVSMTLNVRQALRTAGLASLRVAVAFPRSAGGVTVS